MRATHCTSPDSTSALKVVSYIAGLLMALAPLSVADVSSVSPDKKWEFTGGDEPKIVKAVTNEMVLDLSKGLSRDRLGMKSAIKAG